MRDERDVGLWSVGSKAEPRSWDAEQPRDFLQLVAAQFNELAFGVARLRNVVGLESARKNCRVVRVADAAVPPVPLRAKCLAGLGVKLSFGREHEAGASTSREESRSVQFARAGQGDSVLAFLNNREAVHAVIGWAANLENLIVVVRSLGAFFFPILVAEVPVFNPLDLHAARVERNNLPSLEFAESVAPQANVHHRLLTPLKTRLPAVWLRVELLVERKFFGDPLAASR